MRWIILCNTESSCVYRSFGNCMPSTIFNLPYFASNFSNWCEDLLTVRMLKMVFAWILEKIGVHLNSYLVTCQYMRYPPKRNTLPNEMYPRWPFTNRFDMNRVHLPSFLSIFLTNETAVTWLKYCRYGVKLYPINQSINLWDVYLACYGHVSAIFWCTVDGLCASHTFFTVS